MVRDYCQHVVKADELAKSFARAKEPQYGELSADSEEEETKIPRTVSRKALIQDRRRPGTWNMTDQAMKKPIIGDMLTLYASIDVKREKNLMEDVLKYSVYSSDEELRDWMTWYDILRPYANSLPVKEANFVLLKATPPMYTRHIIEALKEEVHDTPNITLARRIGSVIYQRQKINPKALASSICKGQYKIVDQICLFRRIVDLHHCTFTKPSNENFMMDLYHAIRDYIPYKKQDAFDTKVFRKYPGVYQYLHPAMVDAYGENAVEDIDTTAELELPETPSQIYDYVEFLQAKAAMVCDEAGGPIYKDHVRKNTSTPGRGRVVTTAATNVAQRPPNNSRQVVLQPEARNESRQVVLQPDTRNDNRLIFPQNETRNDRAPYGPEERPRKWCDWCQKANHTTFLVVLQAHTVLCHILSHSEGSSGDFHF